MMLTMVAEEEEIQYHSDIYSFNASVVAHPTNSSLGYGDRDTGSDVFRMIQRFLNNEKSTVCGSIIYVLAKRYPNEENVSNLIAQLRANHVFVYFIVHTVSSGGLYTQPLFDMSSRTNGFCIFMGTRNYWVVVDNGIAVLYRPYQYLAKNYVVSGQRRLEIPSFKTPSTKPYSEQDMVVITVQDHGNYTFTGPDSENGWPRFGSGIIAQPNFNGLVEYKLTIDYNYASNQSQDIEVRMYSNWYHDFLPFASN
uniref:Peptidase_C25 domain-containing protein n=2 Tax=Caenorhabditis tropicalis TaxID=1561998 RepID=A0A1I7TUI8_9PELO